MKRIGRGKILLGEDPNWPDDLPVGDLSVSAVVVAVKDFKGTYVELGEHKLTTYSLTFTKSGSIFGLAVDDDGKASVSGKYSASTGRFSWTEQGKGFRTVTQLKGCTTEGDGRLTSMSGAYVSNTGIYGDMRISPAIVSQQRSDRVARTPTGNVQMPLPGTSIPSGVVPLPDYYSHGRKP